MSCGQGGRNPPKEANNAQKILTITVVDAERSRRVIKAMQDARYRIFDMNHVSCKGSPATYCGNW